MAYREVEWTKEDAASGQFVRFDANGDTVEGVFAGAEDRTGRYGPETIFRIKTAHGEATISSSGNFDCAQKLKKAIKLGALRVGTQVKIVRTGLADVGRENPMKVFQVLVDDSKVPYPTESNGNAPTTRASPSDFHHPPAAWTEAERAEMRRWVEEERRLSNAPASNAKPGYDDDIPF